MYNKMHRPAQRLAKALNTSVNNTISSFREKDKEIHSKLIEIAKKSNNKLQELERKNLNISSELKKLKSTKSLSNNKASFKSLLLDALNTNSNYDNIKKGYKTRFNLNLKSFTFTGGSGADTDYIPEFKYLPSQPSVRDFIPVGTINTDSIEFIREASITAPAPVTPPTAMTDMNPSASVVLSPVQNIGGFVTLTRNQLNDITGMTSYLNMRMPQLLQNTENAQVLMGNGTAPNLNGVHTQASTFVCPDNLKQFKGTDAVDGDYNEIDVILVSMSILANLNVMPSAVIMNPQDFFKMALRIDDNNRYLRDNFISGLPMQINGITIFLANSLTAGSFLLGDFTVGSQILDRENVAVEFSQEHSTNFTTDQVTARIIRRLALNVYTPASFVKGTYSAAISDINSAP